MSVTSARLEPSIAGVGDYIELMKPRVMSLVVFTETRRQILYYALVLVRDRALAARLCGAVLRHRGDRDRRGDDRAGAARAPRTSGYEACKHLFAFSILYLFLLFAVLLVDRMSGGLIGHFAA
jgi:protoheme IX farnesyltransferase